MAIEAKTKSISRMGDDDDDGRWRRRRWWNTFFLCYPVSIVLYLWLVPIPLSSSTSTASGGGRRFSFVRADKSSHYYSSRNSKVVDFSFWVFPINCRYRYSGSHNESFPPVLGIDTIIKRQALQLFLHWSRRAAIGFLISVSGSQITITLYTYLTRHGPLWEWLALVLRRFSLLQSPTPCDIPYAEKRPGESHGDADGGREGRKKSGNRVRYVSKWKLLLVQSRQQRDRTYSEMDEKNR